MKEKQVKIERKQEFNKTITIKVFKKKAKKLDKYLKVEPIKVKITPQVLKFGIFKTPKNVIVKTSRKI